MRTLRILLVGILVLVVLIGGVGLLARLASQRQPITYQSTAAVRFENEHPELQLLGLQVPQPPDDRQTATDALIASSPSIRVATGSRLRVSATEVGAHISVSAQTGSNAVQIQGTGSTPARAFRFTSAYVASVLHQRAVLFASRAQAVLRQLRIQINTLERHKETRGATAGLRSQVAGVTALQSVGFGVPEVIQTASLPTSVASPQTGRNTLLGGLAGLVLAIGLLSILGRLGRHAAGPSGTRSSTDEDDWQRRD